MPTQAERRQRLFEQAALQGGYFTAAQARESGYDSRTVWHHTQTGRFARVSRGFYRLADFPTQAHEEVIAAWVKAGPEHAVVSHHTALALYDLAPIRERTIHLTVNRARRPSKGRPPLPGVQVHTTTRAFAPSEVVHRFGVRLTSPLRSLADAAQSGADPAAILEGAAGALRQGLVTASELRGAAGTRPRRVRDLLLRAIQEDPSHASLP